MPSDHGVMRRLTLRTGKKISADSEECVQSAYRLKAELGERIEAASVLRGEYDKLHSEFLNLQRENTRLATEKMPSDAALETQLLDLQAQIEQANKFLQSLQDQARDAETSLVDLNNRMQVLEGVSAHHGQEIDALLEKYREVLKIDIHSEDPGRQFRITFLDLDRSVLLTRESGDRWRISGVGKLIEGNVGHGMVFTRMLCEARNLLK